MSLRFRPASESDADVIAPMNLGLIRDEGHRNPMTVPELAARMREWLAGEYRGVLFESEESTVGYALYRVTSDFVYLRQLYVSPSHRRSGIGRCALEWLWENAWVGQSVLRIEVLVGNSTGRAFWSSVGFTEYCVTMEARALRARSTMVPAITAR
jgi:GNAT superfamily N-acetyltransferase